MAPSVSAGFKVTHTPHFEKSRLAKKRTERSIESKRARANGLKKRFFLAGN
jgi:hypothetical protein